MNELFIEYDDIMLGKRSSFSDLFFNKNNHKNHENAIAVMRYAFTKYLNWPSEALINIMSKELLESMHLLSVYNQYVDYPIEYKKYKDYYYLVTMLFPKHHINEHDRVIHIYEQILAGEQSKYPKDYFTGNDGIARAGFCFHYMISRFVEYETMNDLYFFFSSENGTEALKNYKLQTVARDSFKTPVDFLHFSLDPELKNDFFYHFYSFKYQAEQFDLKGRKQKNISNYKLFIPEDVSEEMEVSYDYSDF